MGKKRPERTARRAADRSARTLVRDRERLAALEPGGAPDHPIAVPSAAVIEVRGRAMPCPQCTGSYRILDHQAPDAHLRALSVVCLQCGVKRQLWFRIAPVLPH